MGYPFFEHSYLLCGLTLHYRFLNVGELIFISLTIETSSFYFLLLHMGLFHSQLFYPELNYLDLVGWSYFDIIKLFAVYEYGCSFHFDLCLNNKF